MSIKIERLDRDLLVLPSRHRSTVDLPVPFTILIPALCPGKITHGYRLGKDTDDTLVWLVQAPGTFEQEGLLVVSSPVETGEIITWLFNISNVPVTLRKGRVVSRLLVW